MSPSKIRDALNKHRSLETVAADTGLPVATVRKYASGWATADVKVLLPLQRWAEKGGAA